VGTPARTTAERITDGGTEEVPVPELKEGDRVLIRPGASVPVDGAVIEGQSSVDEAMITGESKAVASAAAFWCALPAAAGVLAPFGILLSPAVGALFMSISTVVVAINAQLMRRAEI
jgi:cation transport ATPase